MQGITNQNMDARNVNMDQWESIISQVVNGNALIDAMKRVDELQDEKKRVRSTSFFCFKSFIFPF